MYEYTKRWETLEEQMRRCEKGGLTDSGRVFHSGTENGGNRERSILGWLSNLLKR
jgi:hypothetical protein